jgi:hypothetical protein
MNLLRNNSTVEEIRQPIAQERHPPVRYLFRNSCIAGW